MKVIHMTMYALHTAIIPMAVVVLSHSSSANAQQARPAFCSASDPAAAYLDSMSELDRRDFGYQAQGTGRTEAEHAAAMVQEMCAAEPTSPTYTFDWDPGRSRLVGNGSWGCDVNYRQYCEHTYPIRAPTGWQICRFSYSILSERGDRAFRITPVGWLENELGKTGRYTGLDVYFRATGHSNLGLNRVGARMEINNVVVDMVLAGADDAERNRRNCEFRGGSVPTSTPTPTQPQPTSGIPRATVTHVTHSEGRSFTVRIVNQTRGPTRTHFACWKNDRMFGRWMIDTEEVVPLQAGASYSRECHDWDAPEWRLQVEHLSP